ncbi:hypothetical protein B0T26DRAFT_478975 [Lasiosphaeria miniovina]|uniref:Uncharacterized protein n=1 Tax=Lasiosphaeria miniovina TaxID=1954250 RepID=A0AA40A078_9PEZI|nr:uncharacterized protein B0T26DRAFT_478975 [Lasiosphaeria miniovina]KAK0706898.1 hypothetical protein B0T26DRAFT_478975 [Lasiosphaeria miniovina]
MRLLINLLWMLEMTFDCRLNLLKDLIYLESFNGLYGRILQAIFENGEEAYEISQKVTHCIAFSAIPLNVDVFEVMLAINPGQPTTAHSHLSNYPSCIAVITGSLVEFRKGLNTVSFIHVTFHDFMLSRCADRRSNVQPLRSLPFESLPPDVSPGELELLDPDRTRGLINVRIPWANVPIRDFGSSPVSARVAVHKRRRYAASPSPPET